jgi:hypothetical protein
VSDKIVMPKGDLVDGQGRLTAAGRHYLAALGNRVADKPAETAAELLAGGPAMVRAQALWDTMFTDVSEGAGHWSPDLSQKLDFRRTVTGATVIDYPVNALEGASLFYSVELVMDGIGGWPVTFGGGFAGEAPVIFTNANDITLLGFKLRGPSSFTAWAVKGISVSV